MPVPSNTTSGTAIDLTGLLPYTATVSAYDSGGGLTYDLWYKYTAAANDVVIGAFGYGSPAPYQPVVRIYNSSVVALLGILGDNVPVQFPVVAGDTYYIRFDKNGTAAVNAQIALSVLVAPALPIPNGAILVNDDTSGFPLAVLSSTDDYTALQFKSPFADGEGGDVLRSSGRMLFENRTSGNCDLYDTAFTLLASPALVLNGGRIRAQQDTNLFFCSGTDTGPAGVAQITVVDSDGAITTTYNLPRAGLTCLAPSNDGTLIYISGQEAVAGALKVSTYTIAGGAVTNLIGSTASTFVDDLMVMPDDTILVLYRNTSTRDVTLKAFNPAGVEQRSVVLNLDTGSTSCRMTTALDDPTTIWVWTHSFTAGTSFFHNVQVSDFTVLTTRTHIEYETGAYQGTITATPLGRFGNSFSCPFLIYQTSGTGGGGSGTLDGLNIEVVPMRWLRRSPHLCEEQQRMFYQKFQLDMNVGSGLSTGQGDDPDVMVRWSNDGGHTWSNEHWRKSGEQGQYRRRVIWRRMGQARDRVYEVSGSDPVPVGLVDAYIEVEAGTS